MKKLPLLSCSISKCVSLQLYTFVNITDNERGEPPLLQKDIPQIKDQALFFSSMSSSGVSTTCSRVSLRSSKVSHMSPGWAPAALKVSLMSLEWASAVQSDYFWLQGDLHGYSVRSRAPARGSRPRSEHPNFRVSLRGSRLKQRSNLKKKNGRLPSTRMVNFSTYPISGSGSIFVYCWFGSRRKLAFGSMRIQTETGVINESWLQGISGRVSPASYGILLWDVLESGA
jgi:hypothetical protein